MLKPNKSETKLNIKPTIDLKVILSSSFLIINTIPLAQSSTELGNQHQEEVIVTAQKREQVLHGIPLSVSVVNRQLIENASIHYLGNISAVIPNMQTALPNGEVLPIFSIRGISMADYSTNQSSPIAVYHDEIYLGANYLHGMPLFDLERIEVLKGPQGTLYGKNTTGGAINLLSRTPNFETDGFARLSLGNYNSQEFEAAYETAVIENTLAARIAVNTSKADGYSKNHASGKGDLSEVDRHAFRLSLKYQANNDINAILRLSTGRSNPNTQAVIPEASLPGGIDKLSQGLAAASQPFYVRPSHYDGNDADANKVGKIDIKNDGVSLRVNWQTEHHLLSSITGYYKADYDLAADSDGTPQQLLELDYLSSIDQLSQEFRISSNDTTPFSYIAGIYFSQDTIDTEVIYDYFHGLEAISPGFNPPLTGFTQVQRYEQERFSQAIYGHLSYDISDATTFTSGIRYTNDHNKQFNVHTFMADYNRTPMIGLIPFNIPYTTDATHPSQRISDSEWTGTAKLAHELNNQHMVYSSYSRGYRSSAFNGAAVNNTSELTPVEPEYVNAYEIGAKGQWLDGNIRYSSALFYYDYRNLQFINIVNTQQLLKSADRARIQGLDLEVSWQATPALSLQAGLGVTDSEFTDGIELNAPLSPGQPSQPQDLTGNSLANAPDFNANLSANYRIDLRSGSLNAFINYQFIDDQWFTPFNDDYGYEPIGQSNYSLIDGRLSFTPINSNIDIALWGKNLNDTEYKVFGINLSENFGYNYTINGAPRSYGVELIVNF